MSGGHWGNAAFEILDTLEWVSGYEKPKTVENYTKREYPELSKILFVLGSVLYNIIHEMDYDVSGDGRIKDKKAFEKQAIENLNKAVKGDKDGTFKKPD